METKRIQVEEAKTQTQVDDGLTPDQKEVLRRLEEYPATHFDMSSYHTFEGGPVIAKAYYGLNVCFTCIAGWCALDNGVGDHVRAKRENDRLKDISGPYQSRPWLAMHNLTHGRSHGMIVPKSVAISRVREIFRMRDAVSEQVEG